MMYGGGFGGILFLLIIGAVVYWLVQSGKLGGPKQAKQAASGLAVLEERYAKGEIGREEYLQKKADLGG